MIGRVVSTKQKGTAVVLIVSRKVHPLYNKSFVRTKRYIVDDSLGVKDGDVVVIEKTRPISKNKHWKIMKVLGKDFVSLEEAVLKEGATKAIEEVMPEEKESEEEKNNGTA